MRYLFASIAALASLPALAVTLLPAVEPASLDLGKPLIHYATIARSDGSFRRFFVDEASLAATTPDAMPDGTTIAMETFYGIENRSTVFIKEKQGGKWLYGSFEPGKPDWTSQKPKTVCHACHIDAANDLTFTLPSLIRFAARKKIERFVCEETGRVPCGAAVYSKGEP